MSRAAMLDAFLDELSDRVAAKVLSRLSAPTTHYTSNARGPCPPGKSRSWALKNLRHVPGARKVGRDWVVSFDAWEAWATEQDTERARKSHGDTRHGAANDVGLSATEVRPASIDDLADQALRESGFRRVARR